MKFKVIKKLNEGLRDIKYPSGQDCYYDDLTDSEQKEVDEAVYEEISDEEIAEEIKSIYKDMDFEEYNCNEDVELLQKTFPNYNNINEVPYEDLVQASKDQNFRKIICTVIDDCSTIFYNRKDELAQEFFGYDYHEWTEDDWLDYEADEKHDTWKDEF